MAFVPGRAADDRCRADAPEPTWIEVIPAALAGERVDRVVAMVTGVSRAEVGRAGRRRARSRVDGRVGDDRDRTRVAEGDEVHADVDELVAAGGRASTPSPTSTSPSSTTTTT